MATDYQTAFANAPSILDAEDLAMIRQRARPTFDRITGVPIDYRDSGINPQWMAANAAAAAGGGDAIGAAAEADRRWQQIQDMTIGARESMLEDPVLAAAQQFYGDVLSGSELPYSDAVQAGMRAEASRGLAAGEQATRQALQEQLGRMGGSMADPSYMAAQRAAQTQRMRGMQDANRQIAMQAALQNFGAKSGAAGQMTGARMNQLQEANRMGLAGASYLDRPINDPSGGGGGGGTVSYGGFRSSPPAQTPAPKTTRSALPQSNRYIQQAQQEAQTAAPRQAGGAANFQWPVAPKGTPQGIVTQEDQAMDDLMRVMNANRPSGDPRDQGWI